MHHPLVEFDSKGRVLRIEECSSVDRSPLTEFFAGLMVLHFPENAREVFREMMENRHKSLEVLLREVTLQDGGVAVILSGLDYQGGFLTSSSQIQVLQF